MKARFFVFQFLISVAAAIHNCALAQEKMSAEESAALRASRQAACVFASAEKLPKIPNATIEVVKVKRMEGKPDTPSDTKSQDSFTITLSLTGLGQKAYYFSICGASGGIGGGVNFLMLPTPDSGR